MCVRCIYIAAAEYYVLLLLLEEITTEQLSASALSDRLRLIYETAAGYFSLNLENFDLSRR
jgi:hypothetical protein